MAVGDTVGWGRKVRQGRMWLAVVGYRIGRGRLQRRMAVEYTMNMHAVGRRK